MTSINDEPAAGATGLLSCGRAGAIQGWALVIAGWLSVIVGILIAPVLPRMSTVFAGMRGLDVKISLVATLPALVVALLGMPMGLLAERVGYKRLLLWTSALYGFVGTAPLWLDSLDAIVASRALVGVAEAAIMTCSTSLIGMYFTGTSRNRWLAAQAGTPPLVSTAMLVLGGALGERSWRAPFLVYGFGFVIFVAVLLLIWEPRRAPRVDAMIAAPDAHPPRWGRIMWINLITVFAMSAFLVTIIQFGFFLTARGLSSPRLIGLWAAVASLANSAGAVIFALSRWRLAVKMLFSFGLLATGFSIISLSSGYPAVIAGALVANLGSGFILPALITWAFSALPPRQQGRGTGLWIAASFLGQFLSPLTILYLAQVTGSREHAVLVYAIVCAAAATGALVTVVGGKGKWVGGTT